MRSNLFLVAGVIAITAPAAKAGSLDIDLRTAVLSSNSFPIGSTPPQLKDVTATSFTLVGSSGTVTSYMPTMHYATLTRPVISFPPPPGPPAGTKRFVRTESASEGRAPLGGENLMYSYDPDPAVWQSNVAKRYGLPIKSIPSLISDQRVSFERVAVFTAFFEHTGYQVATPGQGATDFQYSFDAVWRENDIPGYHFAKADGTPIGTGHYVGNFVSTFQIVNSDNRGGPSELTISNYKVSWTDPIAPTYSEYTYSSAMSFYVQAIPEPQTYALMAAGLALIGVSVARRKNQD